MSENMRPDPVARDRSGIECGSIASTLADADVRTVPFDLSDCIGESMSLCLVESLRLSLSGRLSPSREMNPRPSFVETI
jgi:hypothetical protein